MPTVTFPPEQTAPEIAPLYHVAAQERLRSLITLAGGLAHNLRSPLTAIMGRAELIGVRQPELRKQMHGIVSECERINGMLQGVTGKLALEAEKDPRPVNFNDLVERECEFMRFDRHFKHEIEKEYALADKLPSVSAVYGVLARVFAALVQNAVIAMRDAAERRLVITTESSGDTVSLSIRDSGCAIAPEHLPRVFEPGFTTREDAGPAESPAGWLAVSAVERPAVSADERPGTSPVEQSGRGYGLAFAAAAVQGYGGTIEVSSESGAGTTVTITLPVQ